MDTQTRVSAAQIGEWTGLHERQVRKLAERQIIARDGHGRYDLKPTLLAMFVHLREQAAGRASENPDGEGLDLVAERARLASEQADNYAMRNGQMRGELVPLTDVTNAVVGLIEASRTALARVPAKVARNDARLLTRIADAIEEALTNLSLTSVIEQSGIGKGGAALDGDYDADDDEDADP